MYTRRAAALVALTSLRRAIKVCRRNPSDFRCSVEIPNFVRSFRTASESADAYNNFDGGSAENQSGYVNFNRNDKFYGGSLGGVEQNQNPSRVYGQTGTDGLNLSNTFANGGGSVQNQSGYSSSSFDSRNYVRNVVGREADRIPNRQNYCGHMGNGTFQQNVSSNGGFSDAAPLNHGGGRLENSRGGSYGGITDMPVKNGGNSGVHPQNVVGSYYSNAGNYQRSLSESQSGVVMNDLAMNAGSVEVARGSQSTSKLDDLDQLTRERKLKEAVELLVLLEKEGIRVELPQYMALIKACGENKALAEAKSVHEHLMKSMVNLEVRMYNQIIEMYSKCGSMEDAFTVFNQMPERNLTSWDIMISGLAKNGHGEESLELFAEFKQSGLRPDGQMFLGVFSACGVVSDVVEGMLHFESMMNEYGIVPAMEHYAGIVDMLGCAGCLDEASEFIQKMPVKPSVAIWETLMKFCRIHGNVALGDQCAELVQLIDPSRLNEQSREGLIPLNASDMDKEKEKKKSIGQGPLDVRHRVHEYRAGDRSHPDNERLYGLLRALKQHMKEAGYIPEIKCVLHDVDQETKEEALMAHSERLAAAHGFLTSPARSSIRIIKNLRVCNDCHNVFKIISKIVGREIVARDSKRFHHFRDGSCSCNDFW
uniref:Pentatricopeptide repeat protein n=1 Tax=Salvia miltiorrhiza TaxID=226208 RepID=A0A678WDG5_SALMI|nr:pentatricopeptide repeat protein [Salvia miltiorrhiza]